MIDQQNISFLQISTRKWQRNWPTFYHTTWRELVEYWETRRELVINSIPPPNPPQITDASSHPWLANITKYSNHAQLIYIVCTGDNYDVIDLFSIVNNVCRSLIRKQCTYIGLIILHWYQWHMGRWMVFYWFWWIT